MQGAEIGVTYAASKWGYVMKLKKAILSLAASALAVGAIGNVPAHSRVDEGQPERRLKNGEKRQILMALARQIKPYWRSPSQVKGQSTTVRFNLNRDGTLAARPVVIEQRGFWDNEELAREHAKQARLAIQLAAPFDLPEEYYPAYKTVILTLDWNAG